MSFFDTSPESFKSKPSERLEVDGTGIYRRNGNKPIVDQLEEEMNKNVELFSQNQDCELLKG